MPGFARRQAAATRVETPRCAAGNVLRIALASVHGPTMRSCACDIGGPPCNRAPSNRWERQRRAKPGAADRPTGATSQYAAPGSIVRLLLLSAALLSCIVVAASRQGSLDGGVAHGLLVHRRRRRRPTSSSSRAGWASARRCRAGRGDLEHRVAALTFGLAAGALLVWLAAAGASTAASSPGGASPARRRGPCSYRAGGHEAPSIVIRGAAASAASVSGGRVSRVDLLVDVADGTRGR